MSATATTRHFDIRQANTSDFNRLLEFYARNASPALPAPTAKTVGDTIGQGRILLVTDHATSEIAASGAVFELSPTAALTYVAELAGMRSMQAVGGLQPLSMQFVLLGLRLLGHVATEPKALREGATNSIIAVAREGNARSIENIEATGMKPIVHRPKWFHYDELVWLGSVVDSEWKYYYADIDAIVVVLQQFSPLGLFENEIRLHRIDRVTGRPENFVFHLQLSDIGRAEQDLRAILQNRSGVDLIAPPDHLTLDPGSPSSAAPARAAGDAPKVRSLRVTR